MNEFHPIHSANVDRPLHRELRGQRIALPENARPDGGHTPPCRITRVAGIHNSGRMQPSLARIHVCQLRQAQWALDETARFGRSLPITLRDFAHTSLKAHRICAHGQ